MYIYDMSNTVINIYIHMYVCLYIYILNLVLSLLLEFQLQEGRFYLLFSLLYTHCLTKYIVKGTQ